MAEEEQKAPEGAEAPQEEAKKKPNLMMIGLIAQAVMVLAALGVIVKVVMFAPKADLSANTVKERIISSIRDSEEEIRNFKIEKITVNLENNHTLSAEIVLEISNEEVLRVLEGRIPVVKARLIQVLSDQIYERVDKIQGKLELKDRITEALNEELRAAKYHGEGLVREVYFVDMILI